MTAANFTFRTDGTPTPAHETLRVFVNGASAGLLTLRTEEAAAFKRALSADAAALALYEALREVSALIEARPIVGGAVVDRVRAALAKVQS